MAVPTLQEQIAAVAAAEAGKLPTASTGQVVKDDGTDGIQNPPLPLTTTADGRVVNVEQANQQLLNSQYVSSNGTTGGTLTTTSSQGTSDVNQNNSATTNSTQGTPIVQAADVNRDNSANTTTVAAPTTSTGVAAAPDDNTSPNSNTTQQTINSTFTAPILPQPNILDQYSSYTYSISWYMLTKNLFKALETSKNTAGWQLLVQSGGAPLGAPTTNAAGRNQYFSLDYYLDNLSIHTKSMKGTSLAHTATEMSFTVTEPNGITLMQNLYKAVSGLWKDNPGQYDPKATPNYISQLYCLVIRFYGYDENGNLVIVGKNPTTGKNTIVEKYFPFMLVDMKFRVANKVIEYAITGKPIPYMLQLSQNRGTIPFNYEFVGSTVDEVLNGRVVTAAATADVGRATSPTPQTSTPSPSVNTNTNTNNQTNTLPSPANASNAYVDSTGVDFGQLQS